MPQNTNQPLDFSKEGVGNWPIGIDNDKMAAYLEDLTRELRGGVAFTRAITTTFTQSTDNYGEETLSIVVNRPKARK